MRCKKITVRNVYIDSGVIDIGRRRFTLYNQFETLRLRRLLLAATEENQFGGIFPNKNPIIIAKAEELKVPI